jgi:hypothetical protein
MLVAPEWQQQMVVVVVARVRLEAMHRPDYLERAVTAATVRHQPLQAHR